MSERADTLRAVSRASLGEHAAAWDALVDRQPIPSPFLRSWWVEGAVGHHPLFVLVLDGDRLLGGLALEEDRRLRVPRLLAAGNALAPDHVDLVAEPGREAEVTAAVAEWLTRPGSRLIDLIGVVQEARVVAALPKIIENEVVEGVPYTPLPRDFAAYMSERPSQLRNSLDRARGRLGKEGVRYHRVEPHELEPALAELRRLHDQVFQERSLFLPYFHRFEGAARLGVPRGEVVIHQLRAGSAVIAVLVTFEVARRVSYYQSGRDTDPRWRGAGVFLECCMLEQACQDGFEEFDHLRGTPDYKRGWCPEQRHISRVIAVTGPLGRATFAAFEVATNPKLARVVQRIRS